MAPEEKILLKPSEAARLLSVRVETLRGLVKAGAIPFVQLNPDPHGRLLRIPLDGLRQLAFKRNG